MKGSGGCLSLLAVELVGVHERRWALIICWWCRLWAPVITWALVDEGGAHGGWYVLVVGAHRLSSMVVVVVVKSLSS